MEKELREMDLKLMGSFDPETSADTFRKYEELKARLNGEMNNWTSYSHDIDEYMKTVDKNG